MQPFSFLLALLTLTPACAARHTYGVATEVAPAMNDDKDTWYRLFSLFTSQTTKETMSEEDSSVTAIAQLTSHMPRPRTPLAGGADDLQAWCEQVAASSLSSSKLGARALRQEAASRPGSRGAALLQQSKPVGGQPGGEFFLYRGEMLPKGRWEHDPLRTEVSSLQREMRSSRSSAASMQHASIERWKPMSAAASAAELRYGYRWDEGSAVGSPSTGSPAQPRASSAAGAALPLPHSPHSPHSPHRPPPRPPFSEMVSGALFEDMPPPPPPSDVPAEYHIYDMQAERKQVTVGERRGGEGYRVFPAVQPSNRSQVAHPHLTTFLPIASHPPTHLSTRPLT